MRTDRLEEAAEWWVTLEETAEHSLPQALAGAWQHWKSDPENWQAFHEISYVARDLRSAKWPAAPTREEVAADRFAASTSVDEWNQSTRNGHPREFAAHTRIGARPRSRPAAPYSRNYVPRILLGCAGAAAFAVLAFALVRPGSVVALWSAWLIPSGVYETQVAEHRQLDLPDGSTVELGARTAITAHYSEHRRAIVLQHGVAIFKVAHNISRPFVVEVARGSVTAVGTDFQVLEEGSRTVVTVTEGTVLVSPRETAGPNSSASILGANSATNWSPASVSRGEQVTIESSGAAAPVAHVDPGVATAWRNGRLQYLAEPLRNVIADVNRYSRRRLTCDEATCNLLYTGTVFERDITAWMKGLPEIFPVEIDETDSRTIAMHSR